MSLASRPTVWGLEMGLDGGTAASRRASSSSTVLLGVITFGTRGAQVLGHA